MIERLPDLDLIPTEDVVILFPTVMADDLGEPEFGEPERVRMPGCIVVPGPTSDMDASRPAGVTVDFTVFLADPGRALRGCSLELRGDVFRVVGDPRNSTAAAVPGGRNLTLEVARSDG